MPGSTGPGSCWASFELEFFSTEEKFPAVSTSILTFVAQPSGNKAFETKKEVMPL